MIFMVLYIPLIFPASWFLDKMVRHLFKLISVLYTQSPLMFELIRTIWELRKERINYYGLCLQGLRVTAICGVLGTCLGAWIKVFSVHPDLFYVSFIGQTIVAASQVTSNVKLYVYPLFYTFCNR